MFFTSFKCGKKSTCKNARPILVIAICVAVVNSVAEMKWKVLCKIITHE